MADRTCTKCKDVFKYPSGLKRHLLFSIHCKKSNDEVNILFNNIKTETEINNKNINCIYCSKEFSRKDSLQRHIESSKCSRKQIQENENTLNISKQNLQILIREEAQKMLNNNTLPNNNLPNNNLPNNNLTNSNNTINNNINNIINNNNNSNNTIINNNNTIIQHINPFGFEDVRTIPITEMKQILASGPESGIEIIKTIYSKIENKNFYKPNISKPEIACLNKDFNLTIYKSREFCDALFDRCIAFLHHMLYLCKDEYTKHNIRYIYDNIEHIETTMRTEIYDKKLKTIIETEFLNNNINNKDRIKKFIKEIKDNVDTKDNSLLQIKNTLDLKEDNNNEYKISITSLELNNVYGDPKIILGTRKEEIILNLRISRFEESIFYNFWIDRIKNIKKYVMNSNKNVSIGDIANLSKEENKIMTMLGLIKMKVENNRGDDYLDLNINDEFRLADIDDSEDIDDSTNIRELNNLHTFDSLVSG